MDAELEVLEIRGRATRFLTLPTGTLSFNLLKLIPDTGFYLEVENLVHEARASGEPARRERVPYGREGSADEVDIEVMPLHGERPGAHLILFDPRQSAAQSEAIEEERPGCGTQPDDRDRHIAKLKREVAVVRQRLLSIVEEHRTSSEETYNATNEALSSNEELQSLNEETGDREGRAAVHQ